jgi:Glycosyltransferase family 87
MDVSPPSSRSHSTSRLVRLLNQPLPNRQCVLGWVVATVIFAGLVAGLGGPSTNDAAESVYSTWFIAHGDFACMYPPALANGLEHKVVPNYVPGPYTAPLWPLLSGGLAAATHIGSALPFPSSSELGANCSQAYITTYHWAHKTRALYSTIGLGYVAWFVMLAGVVALLRAAGRGRCGWELAGVVLVALVPSAWMALMNEYHPQDLLAMGLVLAGLALALRRSWTWAGVLFGLAVASQQFALLALVPLFVVAPARGRWRLAGGSVAAWVLVALPFVVASRRALSAITIGTGNFPSYGGTLVRYLHLHGDPLILVSRILPLVAAAGVAWWMHRRFGERALEPLPLLSLMAICVSLRLVFEQNMFGYYFLALSVLLILLEIVDGRIRGELVAWITMVLLVYNPVPFGLAYNAVSWGEHAATSLPELATAVVLGLIVWDAAHRRVRWHLLAWFVIAVLALCQWPPWSQQWPSWGNAFRPPFHNWSWQLILLPTGIALAAWPLITSMRRVEVDGEQISSGRGDRLTSVLS